MTDSTKPLSVQLYDLRNQHLPLGFLALALSRPADYTLLSVVSSFTSGAIYDTLTSASSRRPPHPQLCPANHHHLRLRRRTLRPAFPAIARPAPRPTRPTIPTSPP